MEWWSITDTYFVVVLHKCFPVELARHSPSLLEHVVTEIVLLHVWASVKASKLLLKRNRLGRGVKVDPDQTNAVDMGMDTVQVMLGLVKVLDLLEARCLGQLPLQPV